VNEAWGLSGLPEYKVRIQGSRLTPIWIVVRWISVLAQGSSPAISYGLIATYIDPSSVSKNVPTLPQVQADCGGHDKAKSRTAQNEFVIMSMGLAELLEIENSGEWGCSNSG
jgi:hypothetical protein